MCQNKQHKWAKEIKAWADGAIIQFRNTKFDPNEPWTTMLHPGWLIEKEVEYRIKPVEKVLYACRYKNNASGLLNFSMLSSSLEDLKEAWKLARGCPKHGFYKFIVIDDKVIKMEIVE